MSDAITELEVVLRAFPGKADSAAVNFTNDGGLLYLTVELVYHSGIPDPPPAMLGDMIEVDWPDGTRRTFAHTGWRTGYDSSTYFEFTQIGAPR